LWAVAAVDGTGRRSGANDNPQAPGVKWEGMFGTVAQSGVDPVVTGVVAVVVTIAVAWLFYALTLHLAATFFIGDVPTQPAAAAGIVPAVVSVLLGRYGLAGTSLVSPSTDLAIALLVTLVADWLAIGYAYDLDRQAAAILVALHLAFSVALIIPLNNIFGLV